MPKNLQALILTVSVLLMLACNTLTRPLLNSTPAAQPLPTLEGDWRIKLVQTGGIMGLHHEMELTSDSTLTVSDPQRDFQNNLTITPEAMQQIKELVAKSTYQPLQKPLGCADCFIFNLEISSGGQTFQLEVDQVNAPATGLESLIVFLRQMMEDGLGNPG